MRVIIPPISDTKSIGGYIANECEGLPIYKLEKYVGGGKFALNFVFYLFTD